jgi:phage-related protein
VIFNAIKQKTSIQKKSFNIEDINTIIKIKGSGPGSLTANRNESKNDTNPA